MPGLTLPEWVAVIRKTIAVRRAIDPNPVTGMAEYLEGWESSLDEIESDLKTGILQGGAE